MFASIMMVCPPGQTPSLPLVLRLTNRMAAACGQPSLWPLVIPTACGGVVGFRGPEDFPLVDCPCPCPHPGCWAVVWMQPDQIPPHLGHLFLSDGDEDDDGEGWKQGVSA